MASKPPGNREAVQGRRAWSLAGCVFSLTASTLAFVLPGEAIPARANLRLLLGAAGCLIGALLCLRGARAQG